MSDPRRTLAAITHLTDDIRTAWPHYEETIAALGLSTIPGTTGAGVNGGDIVDPVYAANIPTEWHDVCAELDEARGHLTHILDQVQHRIAGDHPATARHHETAIRAARCLELNCEQLAVKDGYCFPDWQHQRDTVQRRHA